MSKKNNFFVVWDGREPGIYRSWDECKKQVHAYPEAKYKSFATEKEAREAFLSPYWSFVGKAAKPQIDKEKLKVVGAFNTETLAVDAACSGNPGPMEYRAVYVKTGEEIFRQGPFDDGTNNVGEFLALVHGLALLKQRNLDMPLYSDSKTAISWVRKRKAATKLERTDRNAAIFELIERAEKWLQTNSFKTEILKWETEAWGEIPADFGRK